MKTYEFLKRNALLLLLAAAAGFSGGCNQTEIDMFPADESGIVSTDTQMGYLTDENAQREFVTVEVRERGGGSVALYLRATKKSGTASEVSLVYAPEVLEAYNEQTGNSFEALPETAVGFSSGKFSLAAGSQQSGELTLDYALTTEQTVGTTYVIPVRAEVVSGELKMKSEDAEYLIFLNVVENPGDCDKGEDAVKVFCVMETNDVNPLNLLAFTLKDSGKYLFDAIVLFSDNIILDETTGTVHALVNDNIKYILNNREKYLTPLQERGMKVILAITPYHTHAGVANLKPATADAFAKELKIICDTYELDGVFFDDEYTALVSPPPTGFYSENTAEAAADLMFRVKRMMPDRWVIAYQLGAIWDLSGEGCEFEADDKTWLPGDYIDYVMVDYSESAWASLAQFPGLPASRFGLHSFDFNSYTPLWPSVERLEQVRDTYKTLFLYGLNPYHRSGSFDTTPVGSSEKMTQVQALERVTSTLYGEEMLFDGHTYTKDW